jgi:hypothetical protein
MLEHVCADDEMELLVACCKSIPGGLCKDAIENRGGHRCAPGIQFNGDIALRSALTQPSRIPASATSSLQDAVVTTSERPAHRDTGFRSPAPARLSDMTRASGEVCPPDPARPC